MEISYSKLREEIILWRDDINLTRFGDKFDTSETKPTKSVYRQCNRLVDSATDSNYKIMGLDVLTFMYRMKDKYKFHHIPITATKSSCIQLLKDIQIVYISCPNPVNDEKLITFLHELGHMQGLQYGYSYCGNIWGCNKYDYFNEVLAWDRAIRRFLAYGKEMTDELWEYVLSSLSSYYKSIHRDKQDMDNKLNWLLNKYGHSVPDADTNEQIYTSIEFRKPKYTMPYWANDWRSKRRA